MSLKKIGKKNVLVLRRPEDEAISLFPGLLPKTDVPLILHISTLPVYRPYTHCTLEKDRLWITMKNLKS
jgi:hypothetical protein